MGEIKLKGYICDRCEHKWPPRNISNQKPFVCPRCKSPYWNVPRKNGVKVKVKKKDYGIFPKSLKSDEKKEIWKQ